MPSLKKRFIAKVRAALSRDVLDGLSQTNQQIAHINHTQLSVNHNQLSILSETNQRGKNSGSYVISESEMVAKIFSGVKMYLDPRDLAVVPHLVLDTVWEHRITAAWLSAVGANDTVLDIGANFGYYGVLAAQKTDKKSSSVILFEANPDLIPYINKTLSVNWFNEQTTVENLAVSNKAGKVKLNILRDYLGSSSLQSAKQIDSYMHGKMQAETQKVVSVQAVTIDEYCAKSGIKSVDLIKMDIEGHEDKAYDGMRTTVKNSPNLTLFIEFTKDAYEDPKEFYERMLQDFGNVYSIDEDGRLFAPEDTTYAAIIEPFDDWVMPVFSKRSDLAGNQT